MFNHIGPLSNNFVGRLLHAHASPLTQNCFTNPSEHSHSFFGYNSGELWKSFQDLSREFVQPVISFESNGMYYGVCCNCNMLKLGIVEMQVYRNCLNFFFSKCW